MHTYYIMRLLYLNVPLIRFRVKCEKILTLKQKKQKKQKCTQIQNGKRYVINSN